MGIDQMLGRRSRRVPFETSSDGRYEQAQTTYVESVNLKEIIFFQEKLKFWKKSLISFAIDTTPWSLLSQILMFFFNGEEGQGGVGQIHLKKLIESVCW